jgi:hypothetical protein
MQGVSGFGQNCTAQFLLLAQANPKASQELRNREIDPHFWKRDASNIMDRTGVKN